MPSSNWITLIKIEIGLMWTTFLLSNKIQQTHFFKPQTHTWGHTQGRSHKIAHSVVCLVALPVIWEPILERRHMNAPSVVYNSVCLVVCPHTWEHKKSEEIWIHIREKLFSGYGSLVKTSGHIQENNHMNAYRVDKEFWVYDCLVTHIRRHIMGRSVGNIPVYLRP